MRPLILMYNKTLGLRFEKVIGVRPAQVAQSVEQRTENPCVGGSIPPLGILNLRDACQLFGYEKARRSLIFFYKRIKKLKKVS